MSVYYIKCNVKYLNNDFVLKGSSALILLFVEKQERSDIKLSLFPRSFFITIEDVSKEIF